MDAGVESCYVSEFCNYLSVPLVGFEIHVRNNQQPQANKRVVQVSDGRRSSGKEQDWDFILEWWRGRGSALFVCRCRCCKCPSAGCPGDPGQRGRQKEGRMMEFARSSGLPATGSFSVHTPTPPTYFFQVMSLLHARLASEGVVEWVGSIHLVCVGPGESSLVVTR